MLHSLNMVIIKHYRLEHKDNSDFFYVRSREKSYCPWCEGGFQVIGRRKRILQRQDASASHLIIRRLKCTGCGRISHELPDIVMPYKCHESATISQVLEERATSRQDSYCENSTIRRWKLWFFLLRDYLENTVHALTSTRC